MSESPPIEQLVNRLHLIRKHLLHAGMVKADRYIEAAIDELVRIADKGGSNDAEPPKQS